MRPDPWKGYSVDEWWSLIEAKQDAGAKRHLERSADTCPGCVDTSVQDSQGKKTRVYLAGPMRHLPDFNYPAFHAAAERLRSDGFEVFNPAEQFDGDQSLEPKVYMQTDLRWIVENADEIHVLPGWQTSAGARVEVQVARAIGIPVIDYTTFQEVGDTDLPVELEAAAHVYGDRQAAYGHPATDFERTGRIWGAILGTDPVPPGLVALCMVGLKISREVNEPKRDNLVDGIGYFICKSRIEDAG